MIMLLLLVLLLRQADRALQMKMCDAVPRPRIRSCHEKYSLPSHNKPLPSGIVNDTIQNQSVLKF